MVHRARRRTAPLLLVPVLAFGLVLALTQPAAAAPRDGVGELLPITATLHQITDHLQEALSGWIGNVWDRLGGGADPNGVPSSATVGTPQVHSASPGVVWGRLGGSGDPNGTPSSTGGQSSFGGMSWSTGGDPYGG